MSLTTTLRDEAGKELLKLKEQLGKKESGCGGKEADREPGPDKHSGNRSGGGASPPVDLAPAAQVDAAINQKRRLLAEISELESEKRWKDILTLAHPLEEKYPLLVDMEMDLEVRRRIGFALVRSGRHHEAVAEFETLVGYMPNEFQVVYGLGYAAYDALYCCKNRQLALSQKEKKRLIEIAHKSFDKAARLRPDSITANYRRGMLLKEIELKPKRAIPYFQKAVANWQALSMEQREARHQERPKYIRSIYHLASCLLKESLASRALELLETLVKEDEATGFVSTVFKEFALGKTLYRLGRFKDGLDHLRVAAAAAERGRVPDFVTELAAGCLLMMDRPRDALREIDKIPLKNMRPYVCWRRADILVAMDRRAEALMTLEAGLERDSMSKHKTLLRMARIHYGSGAYRKAVSCAKKADSFFKQKYGNPLKDAAFLEALCLHAQGEHTHALEMLRQLAKEGFSAPGFKRAMSDVQRAAAASAGQQCGGWHSSQN